MADGSAGTKAADAEFEDLFRALMDAGDVASGVATFRLIRSQLLRREKGQPLSDAEWWASVALRELARRKIAYTRAHAAAVAATEALEAAQAQAVRWCKKVAA